MHFSGSLPRKHTPASDVSATLAAWCRPDFHGLELIPMTVIDNHKPNVSSDNTSATARLNPSNDNGTFDLGVDDNGNKYSYSGVRTTKDGNYVLVFDPERQVFVLHRLDSLFHMNVTRTPDNSDVDSLRRQFPQLEVQPSPSTTPQSKDNPKSNTTKQTTKAAKPSKPAKASSALRKPTTKKSTTTKKPPASTLPASDASKLMPPPPAPATDAKKPTSKRSPESEEEDDDDDDDGGLLIEYPGGEPPRGGTAKTAFGSSFVQPPVAITRRFSDFVRNGEEDDVQPRRQPPPPPPQQQEEEEEEEEEKELNFTFEDGDEDEDEEMEDVGGFKLPSPVDGRRQQQEGNAYGQGGDADADGEEDDNSADLEADLEAEFEKAAGYESESDVSEED